MKNWLFTASLSLTYLVFGILLNSVGTVILQVQNSYGVSEQAASVLEAFKDLSIAAASFVAASVLALIGIKRAMILGLMFVALVCLLMPSFPSFNSAKLVFAAIGVSFALVKVSVYSSVGLLTSSQKGHARFMSFIEAFFMFGVLGGYFLFSAFVQDQNPGSESWLQVYYLLAGLCTLSAILLAFSPAMAGAASPAGPAESSLKEFGQMLWLCRMPLVYLFVCSVFLYVMIEQSVMSWLPTFNNSVLKLPVSLSIQFASILAGSIALGRLAGGIFLGRFYWLWVVCACLVFAAVLILLVLPAANIVGDEEILGWRDAPLAAFIFPMIGFFLAPIYPAINSAMLSALPPKQHPPMSGLIILFSALGGTSGSIITGTVFEIFGGLTAFYSSLVPITLIVISLIFFDRKVREARDATV